jgi:hypothetical protein
LGGRKAPPAQARAGFALGNRSAGQLWLQNANGVILHLQANRQGLMLSLGADAIVISLANDRWALGVGAARIAQLAGPVVPFHRSAGPAARHGRCRRRSTASAALRAVSSA